MQRLLLFYATDERLFSMTSLEHERVFERFYRVPGANQGGCGLGLSIEREIAHRHKAEVSLVSIPGGNGTIARVRFRLK